MTTSTKERREHTRILSRNDSVKTAVAIAGAAAAVAAAAAGYYFYASKDAKKNRRNAVKWAGDFKKEVMTQMGRLNKIDRTAITGAVDRAAALYESARKVDMLELASAARELKDHWRDLAKEYTAGKEKKRSSSKESSAHKKTKTRKQTKR